MKILTLYPDGLPDLSPSGDTIPFRIHVGPITSGNRVVEDQLIWDSISHNVRKTLGLDMEAACLGALSHAQRDSNFDVLVMKGVMDFANDSRDDNFKEFAARASAECLVRFLRQCISKDSTTARSSDFSKHQRVLLECILFSTRLTNSAYSLDIRVSLGLTFKDLTSGQLFCGPLSPSDLLNQSGWRALLLHAPGGSGKSTFVKTLATKAIEKQIITFLLDLSVGCQIGDLDDDDLIYLLLDECSIHGGSSIFHSALQDESEVILIVDGLNEIYGDMSYRILKALEKMVRCNTSLRVVVADRMNPNEGINFMRATINPLTESEIRKVLPPSMLSNLSSAQWHLLSSPFFLDLQIKLCQGSSESGRMHEVGFQRQDIFNRYFNDIVNLDNTELEVIKVKAYEAYVAFGGRTFDKQWWEDAISEELASKLMRCGLTQDLARATTQGRCSFYHQLIHDYLVGLYIGSLPAEKWKGELFDFATFQSNSVESLSFAAEHLGKHSNIFLLSVYDWSYKTTSSLLHDLRANPVHGKALDDLAFIIAAKHAERMYDLFESTAIDAQKRLEESGTTESILFLKARSLDEVLDIIRDYQPSTEMSQAWQQLVLLDDASDLIDQALLVLQHNPVLSWTASNLLRRREIEDEQLAQLRMIYYLSMDPDMGSLRWRIVHTLGAFPTSKNISLLFSALYDDQYEWVRYGALRSLIECAYLSGHRELIINRIVSTAHILNSKLIRREVRRTALVKEANASWYRSVKKLVDAFFVLAPQSEIDVWTSLSQIIEDRIKC